MHTRRRAIFATAAFFAGLCLPMMAQSQATYPNRAIKLVVPYSAGGLPDTVARIFAQRLQDRLGQSVVVDNKPGANGVVAASTLASSPADGYTFLVTDGSMFSINPAIYKNLSYDYKRDFVPVSLAARAPLYLAVHPKTGVNTLQEFVALARAKPGTLNYGSSGIGSSHHLTMEAMKAALGIDVTHVPFKGSSQSVPALIGGQVDVAFSALPSLSGFVKGGKVKLLATNGAKRSIHEPDVPAIAEMVPGFDFAVVVGMLAAAGTPQAAIDRMAAEMEKVAKMPDTIQVLSNAGVDAVGAGPAEYGKTILDENERLAKAIKAAGIKQD
ncbi:MAG: tripartite tricarboxylate transporter substrate binding protein [Rhodoferax sp.]|nr:tripartite tricarboxylate transporter substrate binding protein [Rhodoferax sp.]MBP9929124.1 tripartite tricarboxylate transporter substrate binding protein [Rhodoferax sp.]HQX58538.1 tripartite tricarboxylate transporter substrate binding protein [Burkholderiaceae bacterium]HQZ05319.1 tripartite tricarboxylate transporter substrate binding protein [Burkholderiaceae bacterium]HRA62159.1 tripartite tricarboxylate transporter substrate binding protein [Burkholderiaceae bacterium]